jgi:hypothetical protein
LSSLALRAAAGRLQALSVSRHFGWLANAQRRQKLASCRKLLAEEQSEDNQPAAAENSGTPGK